MENINIEQLNFMVSNFRVLLVFIIIFASISLFALLIWVVFCIFTMRNENLRPEYDSVKKELEIYKRQYSDLNCVDTKHVIRICELENELQELKSKNDKNKVRKNGKVR